MKKLVFILVFLTCGSTFLLAQNHVRADIRQAPQNVQQSFHTDHPDATDVNWQHSNHQWHSRHMDNRNQMHIDTYYNESGERTSTRRELGRDEVPREVDRHLRDRYNANTNYGAVRIERPNQPALFQLKIKLGSRSKMLYTNEQGREVRYNDRH